MVKKEGDSERGTSDEQSGPMAAKHERGKSLPSVPILRALKAHCTALHNSGAYETCDAKYGSPSQARDVVFQ